MNPTHASPGTEANTPLPTRNAVKPIAVQRRPAPSTATVASGWILDCLFGTVQNPKRRNPTLQMLYPTNTPVANSQTARCNERTKTTTRRAGTTLQQQHTGAYIVSTDPAAPPRARARDPATTAFPTTADHRDPYHRLTHDPPNADPPGLDERPSTSGPGPPATRLTRHRTIVTYHATRGGWWWW